MPIVKRLGFDYSASESVDDRELRTIAITQAADAGDESYVDTINFSGATDLGALSVLSQS